MRSFILVSVGLFLLVKVAAEHAVAKARSVLRPHIIWIIAEDASPMHLGTYGERNIKTPNIDRLAEEGIRFDYAFVTSPVCSPSRSSLITGMYSTSIGAMHHRSQVTSGRGMGNEEYFHSYTLPDEVPFLPELFQRAGYQTVLSGWNEGQLGKSDYNFVWDEGVYDGDDWTAMDLDQPMFAQIQLRGGKNRSARPGHPADASQVNLPPYYPSHPVMIQDWMEYLNSVMMMDMEVGAILDQIDEMGIRDQTMVVFITDHGVSHLRSKQYLYEDGIRIPLLIRWPGHIEAGSIRNDLVSTLDLSASLLSVAGIPLPPAIQGRDFFAEDYVPNHRVYAASDRLDETVEMIRSVRSDRYKYIRNFHFHKAHLKPNRYKLRKEITRITMQLHEEGRLNTIQNRFFEAPRPVEELYDLKRDPYEMVNLATEPGYAQILEVFRRDLEDWMIRTGDMGLIPEIELEQLGGKYGSKYAALRSDELRDQTRNVLEMKRRGLRNERPLPGLIDDLRHPDLSVRYWAATLISRDEILIDAAGNIWMELLEGDSPSVRLAAIDILLKTGQWKQALPALRRELSHPNLLVRHYGLLVAEDHVDLVEPLRERIKELREDPYEYTSRVAWRLLDKLDGEVVVR